MKRLLISTLLASAWWGHAETPSVVPGHSQERPKDTAAFGVPREQVLASLKPLSTDFVRRRTFESIRESEQIGLQIVRSLDAMETAIDAAFRQQPYTRVAPLSQLPPKQQRTLFASQEISWPQAPSHATIKKISRRLKQQLYRAEGASLNTCYWAAKAKSMKAFELMIRAEEACQWLRHQTFEADEMRPREISTRAGEVLLPVPWDETEHKLILRNEGEGNFGLTVWDRQKTKIQTTRISIHVAEKGPHRVMTVSEPIEMSSTLWEKLK